MNTRPSFPPSWEYDAARANAERAQCGNCKYFDSGDCRRHAPVLVVTPESPTLNLPQRMDTHWPRMNHDGWCGDFELAPIDLNRVHR